VKNRKRIGILTGGGDVPPLNAVINAVKKKVIENNWELIGFKYGWQGLLEGDFINLNSKNLDSAVGGTILKSSRINLSKVEDGSKRAKNQVLKHGIDGLIVIGGEDTLSNSFHLKDFPIVMISKTIDNDVGLNKDGEIVNYFTLGYPTAASKISSFVSLKEGLRTTAYSHERIIVVESMGMHAGWLALSSTMGEPDFIIIPEFPLPYEKFLKKVKERFEKQKHVIIVLAEGARWENGLHISADENEKDSFGHPKFKGASEILAKKLKEDLKQFFDTRNVNSVNPSYLYRSGKPNDLDLKTAKKLGNEAVKVLQKNLSEPVFLTISLNKKKIKVDKYFLHDLASIEDFHRFIDEKFYNPETFSATKAFQTYLSEIVSFKSVKKYGL